MIYIKGEQGEVPVYVSFPQGKGPWPGVVVVHDALGMTEDLRNQTRWLASAGYLAAAPDLFHWGGKARCLLKTMSDLAKGDKGRAFEDLSTVRNWLANHSNCSGKIGIVGFCYGGGYALALAPDHGYSAAAVNYGAVTDWGWERLKRSCPIIANYGANDPTLKDQSEKLEQTLTQYGVPHEIKVYDGVGHGFMNNHEDEDVAWVFKFLSWVSNTKYDENATMDSRNRILAFFDSHLQITESHL